MDHTTASQLFDDHNVAAVEDSMSTAHGESTTTVTVSSSAATTTTTPSPVAASSTTPPVSSLVVSAGENKVLQLPQNSITITAYALPRENEDSYHYEWTLVSQPEAEDGQVGQMQDKNTAALKLSQLVAGLYRFKVAVTGDGKYGETFVNVTVLNPSRENLAPVAVINPPTQQVNQPNDVVLDGSESTDDDGISSYFWELVSGPVNTPSISDNDAHRQTLVLKALAPGSYLFKLSVTDTDGLDNSTYSNVTVIRETDYPPMANAGSNQIISLPQTSITLNGNASTDDHGIKSYEWIKNSDDTLTPDMTGTRTPYLHLEHLEVGDYRFSLKVTDTADQEDVADVMVFVRPENNRAPVASVGADRTIFLPVAAVALDGSNSTDDQGIEAYSWTQISGPSIQIENSDRVLATISHPGVGQYSFRLTVTDGDGLQASDNINIDIRPNNNQPPVSNAGGDKVVRLPATMVTLDGSQSTDDRGITAYHWVRDDRSLAAGDILNNSDHQAVLQLTSLVAGRYIFTLTVADNEGLQSSDTTTLVVKPDEKANDIIEIYLDTDLGAFTEAHKKNLQQQLAVLYHSPDKPDIDVVIQRLDPLYDTGQVRATFYVTSNDEVEHGNDVVAVLKRKLYADADMLDFRVISIDTLVCQNNCSSHGHCDSHTKQCVCEAFWMQNPISVYIIGDGRPNCEWSVLYVIIIGSLIVICTAGLVWCCVCLCQRCSNMRPKKRHRYSLLEDEDNDHDKQQRRELMPRGNSTFFLMPCLGQKVSKMQSSSLMKSESEFSTDEETIFMNTKKTNGHLKNGFTKHKNRIKT